MFIISSREFREKQKSYFDKVDAGAEILVQRGKNKSYKIVAVSDNDTLLSKEAFFAKINNASEEIKQGKSTKIKTKEELTAFLNSL